MEKMDNDVRVGRVNTVRQTLLSIENNYEDQALEYYYFWRGKRANFLNSNFFFIAREYMIRRELCHEAKVSNVFRVCLWMKIGGNWFSRPS